ncbi:hypothetical protein O6H91_13G001400 [Diphasiastrum complanatum]|uniref:Uncharacterized protein n=2 Tax=Diphasiastrum complanatum TaxID=34168 RepID=A0ACC2BRK7_DIPCM|nr:hypothetical protein O6H91_13G001400 [Diphasiastrum complanatum]
MAMEALHTIKKPESPWLNELLQRDIPLIDIFQRQQLYTGDSVSSEFSEIFGLEKNYSDSKHLYSVGTVRSAGQTEIKIQSQKRQTEDKFQSQRCQSNREGSVSSYMISDLEAAALSGNDVSKMILPTKEQGALEGEASRQRSEERAYDRLQFSSSENSFKKSSGACRAALLDAHCKVGSAQNETDVKGALLEVPTLVGGIKKGRKRSRASRRPPTTVLEADSTNFRSMVQQLTGIHSSPLPLDALPRRGSYFSNFNVRGLSSQVRPSLGLGFGGQNVPEFFAGMPALQLVRQSLISKASNGHIYGDGLSSTETPSFSPSIHERDRMFPFNVLQGTTGISDGGPLKNIPVDRSCSMIQYLQYSDPASQSKIF